MKQMLKLVTATLLLSCGGFAAQAEESFWGKQKKALEETSKEVAKKTKEISSDVANKAKKTSADVADSVGDASESFLDALKKTKDDIKKKLD